MSVVSILAELITVVDSAALTEVVTNYDPSKLEDTPHVAVLTGGGSEEYASTNQTDDTNLWTIRVMVEHGTGVTISDQTNTLLTLVDNITEKLRLGTNQTLNCNVHSILVTGRTEILMAEKESIKVMFIDIEVETKTFKSIS